MDNKHIGHRDRMIQRFLKGDVKNMFDHEILEMLLYFSIPRKDTNPIGHNLIDEFKDLKGVCEAGFENLTQVDGIGDRSALLIKLVDEICRRRIVQTKVNKKFKIECVEDAVSYCESLFVDKKYEAFYAICLNIKGEIINDGFLGEGSIDRVAVYSRKVVEMVLKNVAYSVILTHNHPGGHKNPSSQDFAITRNIISALSTIGVDVLDHIIVGDDGYYSFAKEGILSKDSERQNLKAAQNNHLLDDFNFKYFE